MATITAAMVKELREKSGVGMMDCKTALKENDGDIAAAIDWLRTKGLAKAAKKAGRIAAEGLVGLAVDGTRGAVVEVNSETDFVARNDQFQETVGKIASLALDAGGDLDALKAAGYADGKSVEEYLKELVGTIGENMNLRRTAHLEVGSGVIASYVHNAAAGGLGKIGVLVALESTGDPQVLATFGKQLAMHVAAANPQALSPDSLDPALVESERNILVEQARESGKPENIIEKMVEGRLRKFFEEVALMSQTFVVDGETRIAKAVEAAAKEAGAPVEVTGFVRFALGEGIEKKSEDFAAEVAAAAGT